MLELFRKSIIEWKPPHIENEEIENICQIREGFLHAEQDYFLIFKTEPYIDAYYIQYSCNEDLSAQNIKRFTFHEDYIWSYDDELVFEDKCVKNERIFYDGGVIDRIFEYYSKKYPDWKLKRYYTKSMRVLEHIYHCMRKGSAKEMLYKAGLDEFAANIDMMDEINLMSRKPSDIYGGISMRTLRALNCREGSALLATEYNRKFIKELQSKYPVIFDKKLNNAQCKYLNYLIEGDLTVGEVGRLFEARKSELAYMWAPAQYDLFIWREEQSKATVSEMEDIAVIDPIYSNYIKKLNVGDSVENRKRIKELRFYLLGQRKEYDREFKRSNRKRDPEWQERNNGYVVRYPQTINDFCREAIYMSNCLMTYVDAYIKNDTTILFMREDDNYNEPFITIEIFNNTLMQAYHRFNTDCSPEEAKWILDYCDRHGIYKGYFKFDNSVDELG